MSFLHTPIVRKYAVRPNAVKIQKSVTYQKEFIFPVKMTAAIIRKGIMMISRDLLFTYLIQTSVSYQSFLRKEIFSYLSNPQN